MRVPEVESDLVRLTKVDAMFGEEAYIIYEYHSINDILRHIAKELNGDWDEILYLVQQLKEKKKDVVHTR